MALCQSVENLLDCRLRHLCLDLSAVEDAGCLFIRVLSDLITSATSRRCTVSLRGLDVSGLLEALYRAPLDQLVTVVRAADLRPDESCTVAATLSVR